MVAKLRVLVLGAGFGGLEVASRLSAEAADRVDVTLIDQSDSFVFGFSKLDRLFGRVTETWRTYYRDLDRPSVTFRQERIVAIDPTTKKVETDQGSYDADVIVVALGADLDVAATPGLTDGGHEFYSVAGAERAADAVREFTGGHAVVAVAGTPYKCPPAPAETALMLHDVLTASGRRGSAEITVISPLPSPVPPSAATTTALYDAFAERGITFRAATRMTEVDPGRRTIRLDNGDDLPFDLLLGVPRHRAPEVVGSLPSGDDGWVHVDPYTLRTSYENVFALGDVADAPVPRAGVYAERAGAVVAEQILAMLDGREVTPYDGYGACYIEFGGGTVARVEVTFITSQGVQGGPFTPPSLELAADKESFGTSRIQRWFGLPG
ncbi:MAG TPA: FAD-dependent oxidoreductase [Mycobacteriales bacterium]|nr:FAD-dependent oxidoreductase [Mycobacteriales bacterium]